MSRFMMFVYRCQECEHQSEDPEYCPRCKGDEMIFDHTRPAQWVSIALYSLDRVYGGPEEGGWYYDAGTRWDETLRCFDSSDFEAAEAYMRTLPNNSENRPRLYCETVAPKAFPETRPRYS